MACATPLPEGFSCQPDFLAADEERALVAELERLPFKEFEFHGYLGQRRVVSFGWRIVAAVAKATGASLRS